MEALVATSVTVLAGSAILLAVESSLSTTQAALEQSIAQGIAQQLLDEVAAAKYPPLGSTPQPPVTGGSRPRRADFDDIDDFHGYVSAPVDRWGQPLGTGTSQGGQHPAGLRLADDYFRAWTTRIEVFFVSDTNLSQRLGAGQTSNHRAVQVTVSATKSDGSTRQLAVAQRVFAYVPPPP